MNLILASASPRRRELLQQLGLTFTVRPADADESVAPGLTPEETVKTIALRKARATAALCCPSDCILAADTLVYLDGTPLGKPGNRDEAVHMLHLLSGREHHVCTGVALIQENRQLIESETTAVRFRELSEDTISHYISAGESMDKAGAYGIQGIGALLVKEIHGDYFNVVGLPLGLVNRMLSQLGYTIL